MNLKDKIITLPEGPGVYRFLNSEGVIIYIGKAKNLKKRVAQYFVSPDRLSTKTRVLVSKIADIEHTVVETEQDALLLENNLIKRYQPKYNILLKDGKSYPWICIKNEPYPRVFLTRKFVKDGSLYFGPYSSVMHARQLIDLIHSLYPLRTCTLDLNEEGIKSGKFKACLNLHIHKCQGPCIRNIGEEEYNAQIAAIKNLLKGDTGELIRDFKAKMQEAARELDFEQAQRYKERLELLQNHYSKSLIVHPSISDIDVFSMVFDNYRVFANFMRLHNGCIIQTVNLEFKINIEEEKEAVLSHFIMEIFSLTGSLSSEILVPFLPDQEFEGKNIHIPLRGDKSNLLELSVKNANAFKFHKLKQEEIKNPEESKNRAIISLKQDLHLEHFPVHIECFDNSNIQGTYPVASCVVFKNGRPSKKDYRHFNIKTVVGANDFASMREVVYRRYSRLLAEEGELPQLILIDGGRGQLNFAYDALTELGLQHTIAIIGIAKRLEEIIIPGDPTPLFLDKNSLSLKLLMNLRDEAHRFGITHHRSKRSKAQINSVLREIKGIGQVTEQKLLQRYKSVKRIREAPFEEIAALVGRKTATLLSDYFRKHSTGTSGDLPVE